MTDDEPWEDPAREIEGRRGPRQPPPGQEFPADELAPEEFPDETTPLEAGGIRRLAATRVAGYAFVGVVAVVLIALATGSDAKDLPWGAIIGVLVLIGAIFLVGRRRQLPPE